MIYVDHTLENILTKKFEEHIENCQNIIFKTYSSKLIGGSCAYEGKLDGIVKRPFQKMF